MTRKNKFGVAPTSQRTLDGIVFHSAGEMRRYQELKLLERARKIGDLKRQYPLELAVGGMLDHEVIGKLVIDFTYIENGRPVYEDFKGYATSLARWKIKHAEAQYGIKIRLTGHSKPMRRAKVRTA